MSLTAIVAVRETDGNLSSRDKMVLMALADYADDKNEAWPSHKTLATWTHMSRSTVIRALQSLEAAGYVKAVQRRRPDGSYSSKRYHLNIRLMREHAHVNKEEDGVTVTQGGYHSDTPRTPNEPPMNQKNKDTAVSGSESAAGQASKPSGKPPKREPRARFNAAQLELPEHVDRNLWESFVQNRKQMRAPLTERAATMVINKLRNARDANDALRAAIERNWRTVFPKDTSDTPIQAPALTNDNTTRLRRGSIVQLPNGQQAEVLYHETSTGLLELTNDQHAHYDSVEVIKEAE